MDRQSNTYTFLYAAVMVIVVAAVLAITAGGLKDRQNMNIEIEKKQNILSSINIQAEASNAADTYTKYIKESYVIDIDGEKINGENAFLIEMSEEVAKVREITIIKESMKETQMSPFKKFFSKGKTEKSSTGNKGKELRDAQETLKLPVFVATLDDKSTKYIIPLRGKGLWGPVWGYVALDSDMNTIYGAVFDHKGETPGLGAEISTEAFQKPFAGKTIFEDGKFISIGVLKGGAGDDAHGVDAISGGTITSKGVEAMIFDCLSNYETFFKNQIIK